MNTQDYLEQKKSDDLYFWYKARKNLIDYLLNKKLKNFSKKRKILDIGCGTGTELNVLKKYGQVTALDMDITALNIIKKENCNIVEGNIENIELAKENYDCICCFDILEHINNDEKVLKKIYSALKPGGYLLFTVPAFGYLFSTHDKYSGHIRRYTKKDLQIKLNNNYFKKINLGFWNFFLFIPIALIRIIKKVIFLNLLTTKNYTTDAKPLNKYINSLLYYILDTENALIRKNIPLPFGLTIFGSAKK